MVPVRPGTRRKDRRAWKQVDLVHADLVSWGMLKIGTLQNYAKLENGRADAMDGGLTITSGVLAAHNPEHTRALRRMGYDLKGSKNTFVVGAQYMDGPPPGWAFCMSVPGCTYDPSPSIAKATFEIRDAGELARRIAAKYDTLIERWIVGEITYTPRRIDALDAVNERPEPFLKDVAFEDECEVRIFFEPRGKADFDIIGKKPDLRIAELFTRVS